MKLRHILLVIAVSSITAVASVWGFTRLNPNNSTVLQGQNGLPVNYAGFFEKGGDFAAPVDFSKAAAASIPAVVHIKTKTKARQVTNNLPRGRNPFSDLTSCFF